MIICYYLPTHIYQISSDGDKVNVGTFNHLGKKVFSELQNAYEFY